MLSLPSQTAAEHGSFDEGSVPWQRRRGPHPGEHRPLYNYSGCATPPVTARTAGPGCLWGTPKGESTLSPKKPSHAKRKWKEMKSDFRWPPHGKRENSSGTPRNAPLPAPQSPASRHPVSAARRRPTAGSPMQRGPLPPPALRPGRRTELSRGPSAARFRLAPRSSPSPAEARPRPRASPELPAPVTRPAASVAAGGRRPLGPPRERPPAWKRERAAAARGRLRWAKRAARRLAPHRAARARSYRPPAHAAGAQISWGTRGGACAAQRAGWRSPGAGSGGRIDGSPPETKRRRARPRLNVPPSVPGRGVSVGQEGRAAAKPRALFVFKYIFKARLYERDHNAQKCLPAWEALQRRAANACTAAVCAAHPRRSGSSA